MSLFKKSRQLESKYGKAIRMKLKGNIVFLSFETALLYPLVLNAHLIFKQPHKKTKVFVVVIKGFILK